MDLLPKKKASAAKIEAGGVPRVNLLPREVVAKRAQTALLKGWGLRLVTAVIVVAVGVTGMFAWQAVTALRLGAAQAEGMNLLTQISTKAEIQQLLNTESKLGALEANALATDLGWADSVQKIISKFPEGAWLCSFELASGAAPSGEPETQVGLSGVFSICGQFASAIPYLRDASSVDGVRSATVIDGKYDSEISAYAHNIAIVFDQTIYLSGKKKAEAEPSAAEPEDASAAASASSEETDEQASTEGAETADETQATEEAAA